MKIIKKISLLDINSYMYDIINNDEVREVDYMYIITKSVLALMIGFIISAIVGMILVPFLKKKKAEQITSKYVEKHKSKSGTPTMGGLMFNISTIITILVLFLLKKMNINNNILIILFVFLSYAFIGFIDDFLKIKNRANDKGLTSLQKFILQVIVAIVFFYLYVKTGASLSLEIESLNINIDLGFMYGFFILFMLVGSSNAVNLTDGLDGLAGGLSAIAFLVYGLIAWNSSWLSGYDDIAIFCFILVGGILGFLIFNFHPAKIFMGDTGSLALGATLAAVAILTHREFTLAIVGGVFVIETLSVILQISSIYIRKKKIFPMTPLHHTFEKLGWKELDIVRLYYVIGFILSIAALIYTVWI